MGYSGYALADYHVHPDYSIDATGTIEEHCAAALQKGLNEICFTTHYDNNHKFDSKIRCIVIDGKPQPYSDANIEKYIEAVRSAHEDFFPLGLAVKAGIEVGYYPGFENEISELFSRHEFDYKLVGVHDIDEVCFCSRREADECFGKYTLNEFADIYFRQLIEVAECGLFDAIAHLDGYRRYGTKFYGEDILGIHQGRIEPVFEAMAKSKTGFEINTSGYRHGLSEFYPTMSIVNLARTFGVQVRAIGSDAHKPEQVGEELEGAAMVAHELFPYTDE